MEQCQRQGESARGSTPAILIQATVFDLAALVGANHPPLPVSSISMYLYIYISIRSSTEMYLGYILK